MKESNLFESNNDLCHEYGKYGMHHKTRHFTSKCFGSSRINIKREYLAYSEENGNPISMLSMSKEWKNMRIHLRSFCISIFWQLMYTHDNSEIHHKTQQFHSYFGSLPVHMH